MEVLSSILNTLHVTGSVYFCDHIEPPWDKSFVNNTQASFHLVRRGTCWLNTEYSVEQLYAGDLVFVGPGVEHTLSSNHPLNGDLITADSTMLLCGYCEFDKETFTPLSSVFPKATIVRADELHEHPWLKSTFDQLSAEYLSQHPGTEIIVNKLTEVILIELIRINFGRNEENAFLKALNDPQISNALDRIHNTPQNAWTIENLASEIGMSRAAFAKRFTQLVGQPMFSYLTQVRIQKAKEMLRASKLSIDDIAYDIGYESERAFTKTFGKYVGMTPKQYRKA